MFERLFCFCINSLCCLLYKKEYMRHLKIASVKDIQSEVLRNIIRKNKDTVYGRRFHFEKLREFLLKVRTYFNENPEW